MGAIAHELGHWFHWHGYLMVFMVVGAGMVFLYPLLFVFHNEWWVMRVLGMAPNKRQSDLEGGRRGANGSPGGNGSGSRFRLKAPLIPLLLFSGYLTHPFIEVTLRTYRVIQHKFECEADDFAVEHGYGASLANILRQTATEAEYIGNDRLYDALNNVHPALEYRLARIKERQAMLAPPMKA